MKKKFRIEWMHNCNWRMDDNTIYYATEEEAAEVIKREFPNSQTRIIEVKP